MPAQKCVVDSCVHQMVAFLYHVRKLHTAYLLVHSESAESCPHVRLRTASWGPTCYASPWNSGRVMCVTFCFLCTSRGLHLIFYLFFFWFVSAFVCRGRGWTKQKENKTKYTAKQSPITFLWLILLFQFMLINLFTMRFGRYTRITRLLLLLLLFVPWKWLLATRRCLLILILRLSQCRMYEAHKSIGAGTFISRHSV